MTQLYYLKEQISNFILAFVKNNGWNFSIISQINEIHKYVTVGQ